MGSPGRRGGRGALRRYHRARGNVLPRASLSQRGAVPLGARGQRRLHHPAPRDPERRRRHRGVRRPGPRIPERIRSSWRTPSGPSSPPCWRGRTPTPTTTSLPASPRSRALGPRTRSSTWPSGTCAASCWDSPCGVSWAAAARARVPVGWIAHGNTAEAMTKQAVEGHRGARLFRAQDQDLEALPRGRDHDPRHPRGGGRRRGHVGRFQRRLHRDRGAHDPARPGSVRHRPSSKSRAPSPTRCAWPRWPPTCPSHSSATRPARTSRRCTTSSRSTRSGPSA